MKEKDQNQTVLLLTKMFPEFGGRLEQLYRQDPVFREIALEIRECNDKLETIYRETGKRSSSYKDTIDELKHELLAYLNDQKSNNYTIDNH